MATCCKGSICKQQPPSLWIVDLQVGFFDLVAVPLFRSWCAVFNDAFPMLKAVESNRNEWRKLESAGSLSKSARSKHSSAPDPAGT